MYIDVQTLLIPIYCWVMSYPLHLLIRNCADIILKYDCDGFQVLLFHLLLPLLVLLFHQHPLQRQALLFQVYPLKKPVLLCRHYPHQKHKNPGTVPPVLFCNVWHSKSYEYKWVNVSVWDLEKLQCASFKYFCSLLYGKFNGYLTYLMFHVVDSWQYDMIGIIVTSTQDNQMNVIWDSKAFGFLSCHHQLHRVHISVKVGPSCRSCFLSSCAKVWITSVIMADLSCKQGRNSANNQVLIFYAYFVMKNDLLF